MNTTSVYKLKNISLSLSATILTTCLVMPLTVSADTSSSVDAIMEQLKAFKTQAPKVSTPAPDVEVTKTEEKKADNEPAKVEEKSKEKEKEKEAEVTKKVSDETVAMEKEKAENKPAMAVDNSAVMIPETTKAPVPVTVVKKSKKRVKKKVIKQDYEAFDKNYMSLINQIMSEQPQSRKSVRPMTQSGKGVSGWIYLGRYSNGKWEGGNTLSSGDILPQAGQQYTVKSTHLNLRKSRPLKDGLGKLVKVLRAGEQVSVQKVHRSSRNNYWANITR